MFWAAPHVLTGRLIEGQLRLPWTEELGRAARAWRSRPSTSRANFSAYGNVAFGYKKGRLITSSQFQFDPNEYAYIATDAIYTDHSQITTPSGGVPYLREGTWFSADTSFGSGLRAGFANTCRVPSHVRVNFGLSRKVQLAPGWKSVTSRVDVVNLLDDKFRIRDGSGIGVFPPQYGPRRGAFAEVAQAF